MKIVFIGDSFTRGFGVRRGESWFSILEKETKKTLVNKGINGDTTSGMLARLHRDGELETQEKPDYIFLEGGVNDFIAGSSCEIPQNNYMAMVHQAYHAGIIPVVTTVPQISPTEVREGWAGMADYNEVFRKYETFREFLLKMSDTFGLYCMDLYKDFNQMLMQNQNDGWYADGIHLSPAGHEFIAHRVSEYLKHLGPSIFKR